MRHPTLRPAMAAIVAAFVLAVAGALVPPAVAPVAPLPAAFAPPVAYAADDLSVTADARYIVEPDKAVVRVIVDVTTVNDKPNAVAGGVVTRYFYDGVNVGVQPEATHFKATQDGDPVKVTADRRTGYRLVTIKFGSSIFYKEQTKVRLTYELPAGKPRSSSDVRVGPAFASFLAWAFGDSGTVRVDVPPAFDVTVSGSPMARTTTEGGVQVYRATTSNPIEWYAWINASNNDGLTRQRLALPGGEVIVVRAWPEDTRWRTRVAAILQDGVPDLADRIGLPWPVDGPLSVLEVHTPLLEGYAGFYNRETDEITISEQLDDLTIVHEASHAWFNGNLFTERWITEGLAEEYASLVIDELGGVAPGPVAVKRTAKVAFPLNTWPPPAPIESAEADAREQYGYDAAFSVIDTIVRRAGEGGMRRVFDAASEGTTAYPGNGDPERTSRPADWRRFLDLVEELGGADGVASLMATWALPDGEAADLPAREAARADYHDLVAAGAGWAAPVVIRLAMDSWAFDRVRADIPTATSILAQRDAIDATAASMELDPPTGLEAAYERATTSADLDAAAGLASDEAASLAQVADASVAAAAPRDWFVELGLTGKDPDADLAAARAAWEAGDLAAAGETATLVSGTLAVAGDAGRGRALVFGGAGAAVLLILVFAIVVLRRRSRNHMQPATDMASVDGIAATAGAYGEPGPATTGTATDPALPAPDTEPKPWVTATSLAPLPVDEGPDPYLLDDAPALPPAPAPTTGLAPAMPPGPEAPAVADPGTRSGDSQADGTGVRDGEDASDDHRAGDDGADR